MYPNDEQKSDNKDLFLLVLLIFTLAFMITSQVFGFSTASSSDMAILNNPSFIGEVIKKNSEILYFAAMPYVYYRLHILGKYLSDDNEVIRVDRIFYVTREIYNRYEVGDIISHK